MKAIQIHSYGDVDVLTYEEVPDPQPGPGEVLVRVAAAGVNPLDWKIRSGALAHAMPVHFPFILGWDVSGIIASIGEGVTEFQPGDKVFGLLDPQRTGAYAELVIAAAALLSFVPDGLDLVDAAAYPMSSLTGISLIELGLHSKAGQKVLVTGALGGVGRAAIFALKALGAQAIAGVRASQREQAYALYPEEVVALDDPEELRRDGPFDAVADTIGGAVAASLVPHIRPGGALATVLPPPPPAPENSGITTRPFWVKPNRAILDRIGAAAAAGEFIQPIVHKFALSEAPQAHSMGQKGVPGKLLLLP
jgi:NADPH:quinone reductase-like Zn-dependent oxidoreductase